MSDIASAIDFYSTIALFVIIGIFGVLVGVFVWGRRYNKMLINRFGAILKTELGKKYEKSKMQIFRTSGFVINLLTTKSDVQLRDWKIELYLINRENLIHHIISRFRPNYDMLLTKASFISRPKLQLEIINSASKKITKEDEMVLKDLKKVETSKMNKKYIVKASEPDRVEGLFQDGEFMKMMNKLGDDFVRITITDNPPHLWFSSRAKESTLITHVRLVERVGNYFKPMRRKPKILE
ncbi:MAG: hypothetical protein WED07_13015 [Candidatus Freyarchaeum deiterrae]